MNDAMLDPSRLRTVNEPSDEALRQRLILAMRKDGWQGRAVLVEEVRNPGFTFVQHFAWTGSHRIASAVEVGLNAIPSRVISASEAQAAFEAAGYRTYWQDGYSSRLAAISRAEGPDDWDRVRGLERAGLTWVRTPRDRH